MYYSNSFESQLLGLIASLWLIVLAIFVVKIVAQWKIFTKAKQPGWASIVPFYSSYVAYKIYWGNGWLFLLPLVCALLSGIPIIGFVLAIVALIVHILNLKKIATAFGQGTGFAIGLFFLPTVFDCILAFGKAEYKGVPIDGTSFKELKEKAGDVKDKVKEQEAKTTFEQPTEEPVKDIKFEQPVEKSAEQIHEVVDAEVIEKSEETK